MKTYSFAEVAELFGAQSDWWLRDGCRRGRFPYLVVGRQFRFTEQHVNEIANVLEKRPTEVDDSQAPRQPTNELAFRPTKRSAAHTRTQRSA